MLNNPNFPQDSGMAEMQERLKARLEQAKTDAQKVALVRSAVENARSAIAKDVLSNMKDEISITNLDEVKLHLRNELGRFSKPLLKMLKDYSISADKIEQIEKDMEAKSNSAFDDSFQTVIVRKPKEHFIIDNFGDIDFPQDVSINNLESLEECIEELGNVIRDTFNVEIPTPQVHVEAPIVTVNPAPVNIDATDLSPIVDALEPLKLLSTDPTKPIAVRMSDGEEYVDLLRDIAQNTSQPLMMSGGYPDVTINNTPRNPVPITGEISVDTTGLATEVKQDTMITSLAAIETAVESVATLTPSDTVTTGTIVANGGVVNTAVVAGMAGWTMNFQGTYSTGASLTMEASFDSGSTYKTVRMLSGTSSTLGYVTTIAAGVNGSNFFTADIPAGATNLQVRCSAWAAPTGTINVILGQSRERFVSPTGAIVLTSGTVTTVTTCSTLTGGGVAHDAADSGNPHKIGGKAVNAEPAAVTNNDRANLITDLVGKLIVLPYANPENFVSGCISSAMTGTTSTSLISSPGAGLRNYITQITVSNTHATVGTNLEIQDGNGGTTYYIIPAAAVYGGATLTFPTPLRQPTTATAIYVKNTTTGASTFASASGYKGA